MDHCVRRGMKLLETPVLTQIGEQLSGVFGDALLQCRTEVYSCKMAGTDKRWYVTHLKRSSSQ